MANSNYIKFVTDTSENDISEGLLLCVKNIFNDVFYDVTEVKGENGRTTKKRSLSKHKSGDKSKKIPVVKYGKDFAKYHNYTQICALINRTLDELKYGLSVAMLEKDAFKDGDLLTLQFVTTEFKNKKSVSCKKKAEGNDKGGNGNGNGNGKGGNGNGNGNGGKVEENANIIANASTVAEYLNQCGKNELELIFNSLSDKTKASFKTLLK